MMGALHQPQGAAMPVCLVLSTCHSRDLAHAFLRFGARHVVAVKRTESVLDSAARAFNATFIHALLVGNTVERAFHFAQSQANHQSFLPRLSLGHRVRYWWCRENGSLPERCQVSRASGKAFLRRWFARNLPPRHMYSSRSTLSGAALS